MPHAGHDVKAAIEACVGKTYKARHATFHNRLPRLFTSWNHGGFGLAVGVCLADA
jgi:hypothetical protein